MLTLPLANCSSGRRGPYTLQQWRRACLASPTGAVPLEEWKVALDLIGEQASNG